MRRRLAREEQEGQDQLSRIQRLMTLHRNDASRPDFSSKGKEQLRLLRCLEKKTKKRLTEIRDRRPFQAA